MASSTFAPGTESHSLSSSTVTQKGRLGAIIGVLFALVLFLAVALVNVPHEGTDAEIVDWWAKSSNVNSVTASCFAMVFAGICFFGIVAQVRTRIESGLRSSSTATQVTIWIGLTSGVLMIASRLGSGALAFGLDRDNQPMPGVDVLRFFPEIGYVVMGTSLVAAGCFAIGTGLAGFRGNAFARWFAAVSILLGIILVPGGVLIGPFMIPFLLLWAVLFSVEHWRFSRDSAS